MKNLKMVVFVLAVAFFAMTANGAAQNLGEVVYQQTISTTLARSLLYHFVAVLGKTFDTAMSLSNVRTDPTKAPTPGTFELFLCGNDGNVVRGTSTQLPLGSAAPPVRYNTQQVGSFRVLTETTSFFAGDFIEDRAGTRPSTFVGYGILNFSFAVGTGVANVIDFGSGSGFNISYVAAQFNK